MSGSLAPTPPLARDLASAFARIEAALCVARAHPLSSRKVLLVAVLLDNFCDQAFEALRGAAPAQVPFAEDVLAFREQLRVDEPALGLIFDLCALAPGGPRLVTRAIAVPIEDYCGLSIEDFMVSLYNANTVQRVVIASDGTAGRLAHAVLDEAMAYLNEAAWLQR